MVNPLLCVVLTPCTLCVHIIINSEPGERAHEPPFSHFPWFSLCVPLLLPGQRKGREGGGRPGTSRHTVESRAVAMEGASSATASDGRSLWERMLG